ncbi:hypothetical protein Moror_8249 [Moniliophthora roreri MCA 2997]|uniref:DUF7330 domain-containing protein n=2 Tax=Moniliophthora roreri TaxID=221103 RepID=V2YRH1_MONRO|nr:hypothetical protein Moror_8249 [Moniliophthora roreri MCA 2997]KAI3607992.1 hypothetical protein WG66_005125 [Moniliophthora roreri]
MSEHSLCSSSSYDTENSPLSAPSSGSCKVKYRADSNWDFFLDAARKPVDLSLILPHYRARYQPVDHRMNMYVGCGDEPVKLKICRSYPRSHFFLEVHGSASDVTVWIPSDFKGNIQHTGKATYSAGFINRVMQNVRFNAIYEETKNEDCVVIDTRGHITFRMWDAHTGAPECVQKEAFKRIFGCSKKAPETTIDWDFLLDG